MTWHIRNRHLPYDILDMHKLIPLLSDITGGIWSMSDFYRAERPLIRNFSIAAAGLTYFVGLTLIPFNGVPGPAVLGEMRNELSVIPFALSIVLCVPTLKNHVARPAARTLIVIGFAALCFVMLSLIGNIDSNYSLRTFCLYILEHFEL